MTESDITSIVENLRSGIKRLEELRKSDADALVLLTTEGYRRLDERLNQLTPVEMFERERVEHHVDHDRERVVASETARRLEREVEETARRLERLVDETASRLEQGVSKALEAVTATAQVHAEAHNREHLAHERIHAVEKDQVAKAESSMNKRLEGMNEFRQALNDQAKSAVPREYYDTRHEDLRQRVAEGDRILESKLRELESTFLRKEEAVVTFNAISGGQKKNSDDIVALRETVVKQFASQTGKTEGISYTGAFLYKVLAGAGIVLGIIGAIYGFTH